MADAEYDKLEDGSFSGRTPRCKGAIGFGSTLHQCETELRSTLEDWLVVGFKLGHSLPVFDRIDLNREQEYGPLDSV
jgi:predicted RNase H-like HicB family nuclease